MEESWQAVKETSMPPLQGEGGQQGEKNRDTGWPADPIIVYPIPLPDPAAGLIAADGSSGAFLAPSFWSFLNLRHTPPSWKQLQPHLSHLRSE